MEEGEGLGTRLQGSSSMWQITIECLCKALIQLPHYFPYGGYIIGGEEKINHSSGYPTIMKSTLQYITLTTFL